MAFLPLPCLEWLGTCNSTGIFDLSDTETPILLEAESRTSQHNSTNLAKVLQPTVNQYTFNLPFLYIFYCCLRLRFRKEQNLFWHPTQTQSKRSHIASTREQRSELSLTQTPHTKKRCGNASPDKNHKNMCKSTMLKYFLLWTSPVPSNISLNQSCVLPASFIPSYHSGEVSSWVQGSSHTCCAANQKKWPFREQRKSLGKDWADKALQNP